MEQLKKDAESPEIEKEILAEIDEAYKQGLNGTPSSKIGNDVYVGIRNYNDLKKWAIENGAEKR